MSDPIADGTPAEPQTLASVAESAPLPTPVEPQVTQSDPADTPEAAVVVPAAPTTGPSVVQSDSAENDRVLRENGWNSESFRYREDGLGNLFVSARGWIGEESLLIKLSTLQELIDNLKESIPSIPVQ